MSYMQCTKCGGFVGVVGRQMFLCECPAVSAVMVQELQEAVLHNSTINETTDWAGVVIELTQKGWKR